jgi:nitrogenase-associated protein
MLKLKAEEMNNAVLFWEKPGCIGNQQQKALLRQQGYQLDVRDLLTTPWVAEELRPFFGDKTVSEWFNQSAPDVKSGVIETHHLSESEALTMMVENPLLICRPLLQFGELKQSGFVAGAVLNSLNVVLDADNDLQSCPMADVDEACEVDK